MSRADEMREFWGPNPSKWQLGEIAFQEQHPHQLNVPCYNETHMRQIHSELLSHGIDCEPIETWRFEVHGLRYVRGCSRLPSIAIFNFKSDSDLTAARIML
jgi:hypothetical protein